MYAHELISDAIPPVRSTDSIQKIIDRMAEFRVNHLPLVDDNQYIGLISDFDLLDVHDHSLLAGQLILSLYRPFVSEGQHIYDVIRIFFEQKLSLVPVLDSNRNYKGSISINAIIEHLATVTSAKDPGGIIVLEVDNRNNSLSHIAQIVESDNAFLRYDYHVKATFNDSKSDDGTSDRYDQLMNYLDI